MNVNYDIHQKDVMAVKSKVNKKSIVYKITSMPNEQPNVRRATTTQLHT